MEVPVPRDHTDTAERENSACSLFHDLLGQLQLVWDDVGRNPYCHFTSFIHETRKTAPGLDDIMLFRRALRNWLFANQPPLVESASAWQNQQKTLGFNNENRKQGDEHSLCGLTGVFKTRIHVIIVRTSGHHTMEYNPPENIQHEMEIWLIYLDLEHTRNYMSTTKSPNTSPNIPHPTTRVARGNSARIRRATGSTEPLNDPILVVGSSSRTVDSIPPVQNPDLTPPIFPTQNPSASQGTLQYSQTYIRGYFRKYSTCAG